MEQVEQMEELRRQMRVLTERRETNEAATARAISPENNTVIVGSNENTNGSAKPYAITETTTIRFIVDGRVGQVTTKNGILFIDDLEKALQPLPAIIDNERCENIRRRRKQEKARYGSNLCWIPKGTALIEKGYLTKLRKSAVIVKELQDLFSGEKCCFSQESLSIMAAFNLHNYGGSDEATEMIIAGAYKALFHQIGFRCGAENLGRGCPSQRTIARSELNLATDTLLKVIQEMKDDDARFVGIITDHGHRGGQDHFVVVIMWAGKSKSGERTINFSARA